MLHFQQMSSIRNIRSAMTSPESCCRWIGIRGRQEGDVWIHLIVDVQARKRSIVCAYIVIPVPCCPSQLLNSSHSSRSMLLAKYSPIRYTPVGPRHLKSLSFISLSEAETQRQANKRKLSQHPQVDALRRYNIAVATNR